MPAPRTEAGPDTGSSHAATGQHYAAPAAAPPAQHHSSSGGGGGTVAPATASQPTAPMGSLQDIVDKFPAFATMIGIPEVANLMAQAAGANWSSDYFREQLWNTHWWKSTPEAARTWQTRKLVDPSTAAQQARTMSTNVIAAATNLGIHLTANEVAWYSEEASGQGWDDKTLTRQLVDGTARNRYQAGAITATQAGLKATAAAYGVNMSDGSTFDFAKKIESGRSTTQAFEEFARERAKAAFPTLAKELDAGFTVKQIADPYMQIAAQTLGVNPDTMSLTDPKWQAALQGKDANGKMTGPMSNLDWTRHIMTDSSYGYAHSQNGVSAGLDLTDSLQKTFGLRA